MKEDREGGKKEKRKRVREKGKRSPKEKKFQSKREKTREREVGLKVSKVSIELTSHSTLEVKGSSRSTTKKSIRG